MKHILCIVSTLMLLTACGVDSGHFKLSGRFLNMNQGEFFIYGPEGGIEGVDTIQVMGGRFTYEMPCEREAILMLVFPNFSEQPIFAQPGKSVDIQADASHIKEMTVKGTKANELMTSFRKKTAQVSPPEMVKIAEETINSHPESPIGIYLLKKFFLMTPTPDYAKVEKLTAKMLEEQPQNGPLIILQRQMAHLKNGVVGASMAKISGTDIDGNTVSNAEMGDGITVISTWGSWNYQSQEMQRKLRRKMRSSGGRLHLLSICVDADRNSCRNIIKRDTLSWPIIFDNMLFDSPAMQKAGLADVPDNIVVKDRKVVARSLSTSELEEKIDQLLNERH